MTREVITLSPDSSIMQSIDKVASKQVSSLVVIENNKPIAVVSQKDIIRGIINKKAKIKDIMDKEFIVVSPTTKFSQISKHLRKDNIKRFPVVDNNKLVGLITESDIVEATRDFTRFHQIVQDIILTVFGLATAFFLFYFSPLRASILGF